MPGAAFQDAVLRETVRTWGRVRSGAGDEGMTTLEVLIIAGCLIALAIGAVVVITDTAQGRVGGVVSPSSFLSP